MDAEPQTPSTPKKRSTASTLIITVGAIFALLVIIGAIENAFGVGDKKASPPPAAGASTTAPRTTSPRTTATTVRATTTTARPTTTTRPAAPTTTTKPAPKPKEYSRSDKASALTLGAGLLQDVQTHNDLVSRDAQLGLASEVTADCRAGYLAVPGWRSTLSDMNMPANIKTPLSRGIDETEAAYKSCVGGDFDATKEHWNAAFMLFTQSTDALHTWAD